MSEDLQDALNFFRQNPAGSIRFIKNLSRDFDTATLERSMRAWGIDPKLDKSRDSYYWSSI